MKRETRISVWHDDSLEPVSQQTSSLVLGVADEDENLSAISQFWSYADALVIGEVSANKIYFCTEGRQQGFLQFFARLMLSRINDEKFNEAIRANMPFGKIHLTFEHHNPSVLECCQSADSYKAAALALLGSR